MVDKVPMTQDGFTKLQEELRWRQQEERPRIIEAISEARAHGDLSENAEYHAAKEAQSHNEGRVGELEDLIARAEVIDLSKRSGSKIKFGARVKLVVFRRSSVAARRSARSRRVASSPPPARPIARRSTVSGTSAALAS